MRNWQLDIFNSMLISDTLPTNAVLALVSSMEKVLQ
jgi:hypothetical protein